MKVRTELAKGATPSDWDARTVAACRRGDRDALQAVLRVEAPLLKRTLCRLVGSQPEVDDLLQKTLIVAVRAFPRFRGEAAVRTWLTGIAVRTALEYLRSPQRRRRLELVPSPDRPDEGAPPEAVVDERRCIGRIAAHLGAIGPKKRVAFVLHVIEGRPLHEVAVLVGASRAATKTRVFVARRELLKRMRRDCTLADLFEERES
jgi:RNA polymerase sigma-70 factor (ECF subfamily)